MIEFTGCRTIWPSSNTGKTGSFYLLSDCSSIPCWKSQVLCSSTFADVIGLFFLFILSVENAVWLTKIRVAYLSVCSSRIASQGIALDDPFDDSYPFSVASELSSRVEASSATEIASSSTSRAHPSVLSRFKTKIRECWLYAVQRWPSVCSLPCKLLVT